MSLTWCFTFLSRSKTSIQGEWRTQSNVSTISDKLETLNVGLDLSSHGDSLLNIFLRIVIGWSRRWSLKKGPVFMEHWSFTFQSRKTLQERHMVSQWKPSCLLSELSDCWCLSRWKSCGGKRWEHVGEQCHTPLQLVSGGRHESISVALLLAGFDRTLVSLFHLNIFSWPEEVNNPIFSI